jgi:hypothetical protein
MFRKRTEEFLGKFGLDPATLDQARRRVQAVTTAEGQAAMAERLRLQRIMGSGIETPATLRSFALGEPHPQMGGTNVKLELTVEPAGGPPYDVSIEQVLPPAIPPTLAAGQRLTVKVASDDPNAVMLWNTPHAAGGADPDTGRPAGEAAPAGDRIARLEQLQALRTSGVLTEEEFQTQKAKILGS